MIYLTATYIFGLVSGAVFGYAWRERIRTRDHWRAASDWKGKHWWS